MVRYIGLPNRNKGAPLVLPGGPGGLTTHVMSDVTQLISATPGADAMLRYVFRQQT